MSTTSTAPDRGRKDPGRAGRARPDNVAAVLQSVLPPIILLALWEVVTRLAPSPFFPPPSEIALAAVEEWFGGPPSALFLSPTVFEDVLPSVGRLASAWVIAVAVGVTLGLLIGISRTASDYFEPLVELVRAIPASATLPVFIILLGAGSLMRVAFIAFSGIVWIILINTILGARQVEPVQLETARAFALPRATTFFAVILPAAAPKIFAGLRISIAGALILMVVSELILSTNGIGYQLIQAQRSFALLSMWTSILLLAILGLLFNLLLTLLENRVLRWHRDSRRFAGR